jgi:ABC-2 type transport system ATP-binding protein
MTKEIAISVNDLHKSFRLPTEKSTSLKQTFVNRMRGIKGYKEQKVLKGLSFEIEKGDFFGIVGRNGSGKSTLLKLLAGIYVPDKGSIAVNGSLVPFIELGVGFNPELTGRENVYLNGALLGFSNGEIDKMYNDIVDFAELHEFMNQKLKNYSSGMQVRLAFSIAIKAQGDILVLDEVLAVGDSAFQQKCFDYFADAKRQRKTIVLVSHSMSSVQRFCNKAILIDRGKIVENSSVSIVASKYENLFIDDINNEMVKDGKTTMGTSKSLKFEVKVSFIQNKGTKTAIVARQPFKVKIDVLSKINMRRLNIGLNIRDAFDNVVFSTDMRLLNDNQEIGIKENQRKEITFDIENYFTNGEYVVDIAMVDEAGDDDNKLLYNQTDIARFKIMGIKDHQHGMFHPDVTLEVKSD